MPITLTAINRFPVKSCRGETLQSATVEPWGLAGDRRWMLVGEDGEALTAREYPRLVLAVPRLGADGSLDLTSPDVPAMHVDVPGPPCLVPVSVFDTPVLAAVATPDAHAWFSKITGVPSRLVYLDDPKRRHPNPHFARSDDLVSLADGFPLLLTAQESLDQVNDWILAGPRAEEGPLPMIRFRPSVVVRGAAAFAEDGWRRVRIGTAQFRAVKGCARCVLTTVHPQTAVKGKEPIATLARYRRWDGATWFGMNLIPDAPGAMIRVGDAVEVLEAVEAPDGPPR